MSKILIHSNAPWVPSGYGVQTAHMIDAFTGFGHEVVVSCYSGLTGSPLVMNDVTYLPHGQMEFGLDVLPGHIAAVNPDLVITLMDIWKLMPIAESLKDVNLACWVPVDCTPLSKIDAEVLKRSGARPIAMSKHGRSELETAGFSSLYVPHSVDTDVFKPLSDTDRADYRQEMGLTDRFVIGICSANNDTIRKGFPEQFEAFRKFHKLHPETFLMIHSVGRSARGLNLEMLAYDMGLPMDSIRITDTYAQVSGVFDRSLLADWYGVLDILSQCSYAEAFGVPALEAQACGTPVVSTYASAMREMNVHGWGVEGEPYWNHVHAAWWKRPNVNSIVRAYNRAFRYASSRRDDVVDFASNFDVETVENVGWLPVLKALLPEADGGEDEHAPMPGI